MSRSCAFTSGASYNIWYKPQQLILDMDVSTTANALAYYHPNINNRRGCKYDSKCSSLLLHKISICPREFVSKSQAPYSVCY